MPRRYLAGAATRVLLLGGVLLSGCSSSSPVETGPRVASISMAPAAATVAVAATLSLSATPLTGDGQSVPGQAVTWASSNPALATVTDGGSVTGVAVGSVTITASAAGKVGSVALTVTPGSVTLGPAISVLDIGGKRQLAARVLDARGNPMTGEPVAWSSGNTSVATVNTSGLVTGVSAGAATITAASGGQSATVTVNSVEPVSDYGFSDPVPLLQFGAMGGGWQEAYNTFGFGSKVADTGAPVSPPDVLQVRYPAGFVGGSAPLTVYFGVPGQPRQLYAAFAWKVSNPWQGHSSSINKVAFLKLGTADQIALVMYGPPGGPWFLDVIPEFAGIAPTYYRHLQGAASVSLGQWHKVELFLDRSTGVVQWWMDDTLIGNVRMPFNAAGFTEVVFSPTWGGLGETKARDDYFWFDHVHVSIGR